MARRDSRAPVVAKEARSGGQMVEQATHLLDLARHLVGEADVVAARSATPEVPLLPGADVADVAATLLEFPARIPGTVTATCALGGRSWIRLELVCTGLHVVVTQDAVRYDDGHVVREVRTQGDPFVAQNRAFLHAVRTGDRSRLYCDIEDALETHRLAHDVLEATAR
ncbi:MAG: Gfo/Idh/MocA family oxidoreductase [Trueperaceae bacterium]|nr:Gfo/Idh/MocA family oxidoreductase [Trueperaceae bacterium]